MLSRPDSGLELLPDAVVTVNSKGDEGNKIDGGKDAPPLDPVDADVNEPAPNEPIEPSAAAAASNSSRVAMA